MRSAPNREHAVCFDCRLSNKIDLRGCPHWTSIDVPKCPQCAGPRINMGTAFRAPKKNDLRGWKAARHYLGTMGRNHQAGKHRHPLDTPVGRKQSHEDGIKSAGKHYINQWWKSK